MCTSIWEWINYNTTLQVYNSDKFCFPNQITSFIELQTELCSIVSFYYAIFPDQWSGKNRLADNTFGIWVSVAWTLFN